MTGNLGLWRRPGCEMAHTTINICWPLIAFLAHGQRPVGTISMSAIGPKQTCASALHMSAFRGKADMALCAVPTRLGHETAGRDDGSMGRQRKCRTARTKPRGSAMAHLQ